MWSIVLMGLAGLLVGGALSFRQQKKPLWTQIGFYMLAGMSLLAAYLLTLPGSETRRLPHLPNSPGAAENRATPETALHEN
jgi:hypothetical protein